MRPEFWRDRWSQGQIGFHQRDVDTLLKAHWTDLRIGGGARVFVPLCGKSLDINWLCDLGHRIVGVELSDVAVQAYCAENGIPARRRVLKEFDVYEAPRLALLCGDYFGLTPSLLGEVSAIYDRAALIAFAADQRGLYVEHMDEITGARAPILLITLEFPQAEMNGPPFSVDSNEIERLYSRSFLIYELARRNILAAEPRLRARGLSQLFEVCYRLVPRRM